MPVPDRGPKFDVSVPNAARIYDCMLDGKDNYQADRDAAERLLKLLPDVQDACRQNRYFLQRVVSYLVGQCGIRQIIDIGSGLPTRDNVHQVARRNHPDTRVVYVDYDPVVVSHANNLLAGGGVTPGIAVVHADAREPKAILGDPKVTELIDFELARGSADARGTALHPGRGRPARDRRRVHRCNRASTATWRYRT